METLDRRIKPTERLVSLDAFRGLTMILLISSSFGLYYLKDHPVFGAFAVQFTHHEWNGLYFWDLIQPFFMFIVGVAMPFSFAKRWERGESWGESLKHVLKRCATLLFLGVLLHCWYNRAYVWELWNVLSQLSVTYLVAFLFMKKSIRYQIIASLVILLGNYLLYRFIPVYGPDGPWIKDANFGTFMDRVLMGKINPGGGWVAINVIGSSAHTMWGVIAGLWLKSDKPETVKIRNMVIAGVIGVVLGLLLDPVTPIIKRICTSSFIIISGGWALLALAFFYWLVDVRGVKKWTYPVLVVGMNSIFIYMFVNLLGGWANEFVGIFTKPLLDPLGLAGKVLQKDFVLLFYWYLCWWLYKRKIFIRI